MMWIVGTGVCKGHLTERAMRIIEKADVVYGSKRAFELVDVDEDRKRIITRFNEATFRQIAREAENMNVVVLSTGDPMVAGLGRKFDGCIIEPGISSVQLALAMLRVDLTEVVVVDAHAKEVDESITYWLKYRHLLILTDRSLDLSFIGHRKVVILENLCTEDERIREGYADCIELESDYTIIFVEKEVI